MKTYGILTATATSPQQSPIEPISLEEAKQHVKFIEQSPADQAEEAILSAIITAAREYAETIQGRDLVAKQYDLTMDYFHSHQVELRLGLQTVDLMQYKDNAGTITAMVENDDFIVDPIRAIIMPPYNCNWPTFEPWPTSAILIRFTCAPAPIPTHVIIAMKMLIAHWYENRGPVSGGPTGDIPFGIETLLNMGANAHVR